MDLKTLNPEQKEAVLFGDGALLLLAGAGSGKTRVLTSRIAYLIEERGVAPGEILAFTFTNKAAGEMKERVAQALHRSVNGLWIGTFHSVCARLLRREIDALGYDANFAIYDTSDQRTLIKQILREDGKGEQSASPAALLHAISTWKNEGVSAETAETSASDPVEREAARVYARYERAKKANNALDFDDLILKVLELFQKFPDRLAPYSQRFRYVFVDEYQDTNRVQYDLIRAFAAAHGNLCVVGDADQSIYGWRGADIHNILDFEKDYPRAKTILLEQNYRSTKRILQASNTLIACNEERKKKNLWTSNPEGDAILYRRAHSEFEEAQIVLQWMEQERYRGRKYADMAVLYRTNAQSRPFEEALVREGIPYRVVGGLKFYDRAEIKDLIAYMSLVVNPADDVAFRRVVNQPKRGIGITSLDRLAEAARAKNLSLLEAAGCEAALKELPKAAREKFAAFSALLDGWRKTLSGSLSDFVKKVYRESGYEAMLAQSRAIEDQSRIENIDAFTGAMAQYEEEHPDADLVAYLQNLSLMSDVDKTEESKSGVSLMTIHAAKGLEFPVVFVAGLEDGLFPSGRTMDEGNLEEERRLFYVAMTRAEEKLYLSAATTRRIFGKAMPQRESRFLEELQDTIRREDEPISEEAAYRRGDQYKGTQDRFRPPRFSDPKARAEYDARRQRIRKLVQEATGKELAKEGAPYRVGDRVEHRKFGAGMIVAVENRPGGDEITVAFEKKGIKRLNAALAPLKRK
uniref:ATP-dependent helicase n=1 Tax=Ndongobacter massiliensis TaxID=1871025 RepID=UPI00093135CC|nr:UvrD-helicase domain-containing protein [Ndongobacter massiliensis]